MIFTTKNKFLFFILACALHAGFLMALFGFSLEKSAEQNASLWQGGEPVFIAIAVKPATGESQVFTTSSNATHVLFSSTKNLAKPKSQNKAQMAEQSTGSRIQGLGLDAHGADTPSTLAMIRKKIDSKKYTPLTAQENNLTGTVKLLFQMHPTGLIMKVSITKSSGHRSLDQAALQTLRKAEPFPYYKNPIAIELEYQ